MANMDAPSNFSRAKSSKGSTFSPDAPDSRQSKIKPNRTASLSSKHGARASDMQQQVIKLQEDLSSEKEERLRAMEELSNMKKLLSSQKTSGGIRFKVEAMEKELQRVKESENKMFESLMSQTRVLEQTKISLEEVKLENKALRESKKDLECSKKTLESSNKSLEGFKLYGWGLGDRNFEKPLPGNDLASEDEIRKLQDELRLSADAEEKSKIAMDGLASVLKEVTLEVNQLNTELATTKTKLEKATAEEESLRSSLKSIEEKYQTASENAERFRLELEESVAHWNEKENGFITCIKASDEEISKAKEENEKLFVSQKAAREENANLRDIVKQAVSEATIVKESLELTRRENTQLKEQLAEKEEELKTYKHEYESLRVSEAAATQSLKELQSMLSATSTYDSSNADPSHETSEPNMAGNGSAVAVQVIDKLSKRIRHGRRHSIGDFGKIKDSEYDMPGSPEHKERETGSISNMSEVRAASSSTADDDAEVLFPDDFDQTEEGPLPGTGQGAAQLKRKKTLFQKFGGIVMLKGKASCKQSSALPPVGGS